LALPPPAGTIIKDRLAAFSNTYDLQEVLGQGSTSVVYRAARRSNGKEVALKVVSTSAESMTAVVMAEYILLKQLDHPNIVRAFDFHMSMDNAALELSLFVGDRLGVALQREWDKRWPEAKARVLFVALLEALAYLHERRIVHRDVKPDNVMVSANLAQLQLIDFNIARHIPEGDILSPTCTPLFAPPEVCKYGVTSDASDIWGAGVCLCMMLSGRCPRPRESPVSVDILMEVSMLSEPSKDTLRQCLAEKPSKRPRAKKLLEAVWLQELPVTVLQEPPSLSAAFVAHAPLWIQAKLQNKGGVREARARRFQGVEESDKAHAQECRSQSVEPSPVGNKAKTKHRVLEGWEAAIVAARFDTSDGSKKSDDFSSESTRCISPLSSSNSISSGKYFEDDYEGDVGSSAWTTDTSSICSRQLDVDDTQERLSFQAELTRMHSLVTKMQMTPALTSQ